ncbi:MAG: acetyl-CoA carboxylase carboxyltransferase subunit alpha [Candidatus Aminicenantes bacterium]|nr:acetyl-CoA carboxylase carboxyltransferase subunit alpha [Candidatus Aminicenantes bacterium]
MDLEFEKPIKEIENKITELKELSIKSKVNFTSEITELEKRCQKQIEEIYSNLTSWQILQIARHPKRPVLQDYIPLIFNNFIELHGDRVYGDDRALIGGFATLDHQKLMLIGHNKGKTVEENVERNFGMAKPEGYRKALRLMKIAEKFNIPIVTFIDTQGAYPGLEAEKRGQAEAIASNLTEMAQIEVPIITLVTGEGGSGGAIGIGVGDVILMLSFSIYSVISPEGCASILWRDAKFAPDAAEALQITAPALLKLKVINEIVKEPIGSAHRNYGETALNIKKCLIKYLQILKSQPVKKLLRRRFELYAQMGNIKSKQGL